MAQAVEKIEPQQSVALTPMAMLDRALANNAGMDMIEKLMALQERWDANQARKAFDEAVSNAKAKIPPIVRNRAGHNSKRYADFAAIASVVDPVLADNGLSYRFRTMQTEKAISVTCVLSHKSGHFEETTLSGPADQTGNKNPIQAIGSTLTYLQRYSLVQMLGLAATEDDDGRSAADGGPINQDQVSELVQLADSVNADKEKFCRYLKVESFAAISAKDFDRAKAALNAKRKA